MRLFVGLYPPEEACAELRESLRAAPGGPVRLTPVEKWHVTLVFLGEVADDDVPAVDMAIGRAVEQAPSRGAGIRLRLAGGGRFGKALWAGVDGDLDALHRLHRNLRGSLAAAGSPQENRPLTPHLTVSYQGSDAGGQALLRDFAGRPWVADEVALVRSHQGRYEVLRTWEI